MHILISHRKLNIKNYEKLTKEIEIYIFNGKNSYYY